MTAIAGVIGHRRVVRLLERELGTPASAYMFVGATGVGKATVAVAFAALLLCPESGEHDEPCRSCRRVGTGNHPDLILVEPEGRQSVGVDQARQTIQHASMMPVESSRKVFVFEDAGAMTEQAANALLKTLEEPTRSTVFILVCESEDQLPATIASRCRTVHFGRVADEDLAEGLVGRGLDHDRAGILARMAGGRPGLALTLMENPEAAQFRAAWLSVPLRVTDRPGESFRLAQEMLASADPLVSDVADDEGPADKAERDRKRARMALLASGLEILASWYADAAAIQMGAPIRNRDLPVATLTQVSPRSAVRNAERVLDAVADLQANLRPQLLLAELFTGLAVEAG